MTTLSNRPNTALLVIDVQNGVMEGAPRRDDVIKNINSLVDKARAEDVPVVWVQHSDDGPLKQGSEAWQYVPELDRRDERARRPQDATATRSRPPTSRTRLAERGVGRLVVTGAQTDACIRSTIHGAFTRGYDVTLVGDAHTTEDLTQWGAPLARGGHRAHQPLLEVSGCSGRSAGTVETAEVSFEAPQTR